MPIAESFQTSCGRLLEWLDKVVPVVESTKVDNSTESEVSHRINFPSLTTLDLFQEFNPLFLLVCCRFVFYSVSCVIQLLNKTQVRNS